MNKLSGENRQKILDKLLESELIKKTYATYIIKEIPFEKWVEDTMDRLIKERERQLQISETLNKLKEQCLETSV